MENYGTLDLLFVSFSVSVQLPEACCYLTSQGCDNWIRNSSNNLKLTNILQLRMSRTTIAGALLHLRFEINFYRNR